MKLPAFEGVRYRTFSTLDIQGPMTRKALDLAVMGKTLLGEVIKKLIGVGIYPEGTTLDNMTEKSGGSDVMGKFLQTYQDQRSSSGRQLKFEAVDGKIVSLSEPEAKAIVDLWEEQQVYRSHMNRLLTILANLRTVEYYWDPEKKIVVLRAPLHTLTHEEIEYLGLQVAKESKEAKEAKESKI